MDHLFTIDLVKDFIAKRFPDPEPNLDCVKAYRATASLVFSAAILNCGEPTPLRRFTRYPAAFIAAVAWNMNNNRLWSSFGYNSSHWLRSTEEMDDRLFFEDVDVALGNVWCPNAEFPNDAFDSYQIYREVTDVTFHLRINR